MKFILLFFLLTTIGFSQYPDTSNNPTKFWGQQRIEKEILRTQAMITNSGDSLAQCYDCIQALFDSLANMRSREGHNLTQHYFDSLLVGNHDFTGDLSSFDFRMLLGDDRTIALGAGTIIVSSTHNSEIIVGETLSITANETDISGSVVITGGTSLTFNTLTDSVINCTNTNNFDKLLVANPYRRGSSSDTTEFVFTNTSDGQNIMVIVENDSTYTVKWSCVGKTIKWFDGSTPVQSTGTYATKKFDIWSFIIKGNKIFGNVKQNYY